MVDKLFYLGLGSAFLAKEKVEQELEKLKEKGVISNTDAKELLEKASSKGKEEEKNFKNLIKEQLKEAINELGLATKEDLEKLKKDLSDK
ncbi:MAG: hypothetical protein OIF32_07120 [Campylobacterales bacterium]|nr:hypothetical protein [Campylobacterales bacterium]